jgi:extracellular elastinolytic metalloproteinase
LYALAVIAVAVGAMAAAGGASAGGAAADEPGFLTGPASGQPLDIVLGYLGQHAGDYGLDQGDLSDVVATKVAKSSDSGATNVYLQQRYRGIEVYIAIANGAVMPDGRLLNLNSRFVGHVASKVNRTDPLLSREDAAAAAAQALGLSGTAGFHVVRERGGPAQEADLSTGGISLSTIPVKLVFQPSGDQLRLAWNLEIQEISGLHWWNVRIDAVTGELLSKSDYVDEESFSPAAAAGVHDGSSYKVYARPLENPNEGARTVVKNPADSTASPFGWHDTDGATGPEFTIPQGNNVHAYIDADNNNQPDPGEPDAGRRLDFKYKIDLGQDPTTYKPGAVTNLFYWNNVIHDVYYRYGFDEASGNFQQNNYGHGGAGNDFVQAEAQDGGGSNNANFATPPDGARPRMQMYLWNFTSPRRDGDLDSSIVIHEYTHGLSNRLTGNSVNCLNNAEQPGEGWSDWYAISLTPRATDTGPTPRGMATYVIGQTREQQGIRATQYTTDMTINPTTYDYIKTHGEVHSVGYVWASITWEVYWGLVDAHGFNPDIYGKWDTGGNNLAVQLVTDGLKLQPCSPGFVDARDAIFAADQALTGGANNCILWRAFAKRGLGKKASQGSSFSTSDGHEDFTVPKACR